MECSWNEWGNDRALDESRELRAPIRKSGSNGTGLRVAIWCFCEKSFRFFDSEKTARLGKNIITLRNYDDLGTLA
jgi:hypothetical protein